MKSLPFKNRQTDSAETAWMKSNIPANIARDPRGKNFIRRDLNRAHRTRFVLQTNHGCNISCAFPWNNDTHGWSEKASRTRAIRVNNFVQVQPDEREKRNSIYISLLAFYRGIDPLGLIESDGKLR